MVHFSTTLAVYHLYKIDIYCRGGSFRVAQWNLPPTTPIEEVVFLRWGFQKYWKNATWPESKCWDYGRWVIFGWCFLFWTLPPSNAYLYHLTSLQPYPEAYLLFLASNYLASNTLMHYTREFLQNLSQVSSCLYNHNFGFSRSIVSFSILIE